MQLYQSQKNKMYQNSYYAPWDFLAPQHAFPNLYYPPLMYPAPYWGNHPNDVQTRRENISETTIPRKQQMVHKQEPQKQDNKTIPSAGSCQKVKKNTKSKKKDGLYGWRSQSKDRNLTSVILKGYSQMVLSIPSLIKVTSKIIRKDGRLLDSKDFSEFIQKNFPARKTYIGLNYMKKLLRVESSGGNEAQILSKTLFSYIREVYPLIVLNNPQLSLSEKQTHLKKLKYLQEYFFDKQ